MAPSRLDRDAGLLNLVGDPKYKSIGCHAAQPVRVDPKSAHFPSSVIGIQPDVVHTYYVRTMQKVVGLTASTIERKMVVSFIRINFNDTMQAGFVENFSTVMYDAYPERVKQSTYYLPSVDYLRSDSLDSKCRLCAFQNHAVYFQLCGRVSSSCILSEEKDLGKQGSAL